MSALSEAEREILEDLCDVDAPNGAGQDGYCYHHHAPVKWAGRANAHEVCCIEVERRVAEVLDSRTAAARDRVLALCDKWDALSKGETSTTRQIREVLR